MNRRTVLKNVVFVSAGIALLPNCNQSEAKPGVALKTIKITGDQESLMQNLTEAIIPSSPDKPGAKEMGALEFALVMADDCATKADQEKFLKGLKEFSEFTSKKYGKSFMDLTAQQKQEAMTAAEKKEGVSEEVQFFFSGLRGLTLQAYMSSEYYMTKVDNYEMVPGRWHGCFPMKSA